MSTALRVEFQKMKRLHTVPILAVMMVGVLAFSLMVLARSSVQALIANGVDVWPDLLANYSMVNALLAPIAMAVIASRQTDIESNDHGWILATSAGFSPGTLCGAKLIVLSLIITAMVSLQSVIVVGAGYMAGIQTPLPIVVVLTYTLSLIGVNIAFTAGFIALAAIVENQLVSLAAGLLSAFIASFGILLPPTIALLIPWGYYAAIFPATFAGEDVGFTYVDPPFIPITLFIGLVLGGFAIFSQRFNYMER